MESGEISAQQIIASSQYNSNWSPERSRLNYQENGWTPSDDTVREWIQVSPAPSDRVCITRKPEKGFLGQILGGVALPGTQALSIVQHRKSHNAPAPRAPLPVGLQQEADRKSALVPD